MAKKVIKTFKRRQYDQKKIQKRLRKNENYIKETLYNVFAGKESGEEVNLYQELVELREEEKFLDLAMARYLVGNGLVRPVLNGNGKRKTSERKIFNFRKQTYVITKKGKRLISKQIRLMCESTLPRKTMAFLVVLLVTVAIVATSISALAIQGNVNLIMQIAQNDDYGLVVFHYTGCESCDRQLKDLLQVLPELEWSPYLFVELNEKLLKDREKYLKNKRFADLYGIETVPEVWLVKRNEFRGNVGYGYTPVGLIMDRICETYTKWNKSAGKAQYRK